MKDLRIIYFSLKEVLKWMRGCWNFQSLCCVVNELCVFIHTKILCVVCWNKISLGFLWIPVKLNGKLLVKLDCTEEAHILFKKSRYCCSFHERIYCKSHIFLYFKHNTVLHEIISTIVFFMCWDIFLIWILEVISITKLLGMSRPRPFW